jgi:iron complex outermembrane receptor protein
MSAGRKGVLPALALVQILIAPVYAVSPVDEELSYLYGDDAFVSIATGYKQHITEAPAVASVITAEHIRAMGLRDLDQILEAVPGLHVALSPGSYNPVYSIRGIYSSRNPQTLVLINGFPITHIFAGNRGEKWAGMPVEMIARVEVIRGPGSALYGADALAGVINIITKNANDIDGLEAGASYGSFDTQAGWLLYGGLVNGWSVAFGLEVLDTDGHREEIGSDEQTRRDAIDMTSATLAPGSVNLEMQGVDLRLELEKAHWKIRAGYQGRYGVGTGAGLNQALDPFGSGNSERLNLDVTYQIPEIVKNWDFKTSFSYFDTVLETDDTRLLPSGAFGFFPEGMVGEPSQYERHYRYDMSALFSGIEAHQLNFGLGYHYLDLYRIEESKNFDLSMGFPPVDLGSVVAVSGDERFNEERHREITYFFMQDDWKISRDLSLTGGLRYDHFSDFGGTLNPRLALVWSSGNLTSKFLYGRAFRAPSIAEQFNRNNPVAIGNQNLDPETIDSYEVAFDYAYSPDMRLGLNLFYYQMEDMIRFMPVAENKGSQMGKGLELEFDWQASPVTQISANYAYQRARDKEAGLPVANVPEHQLFLRWQQQLLPQWSLSTSLNGVFDRCRAAGDDRQDIEDYIILDLTLTGRELMPGLAVSISMFNATDEDAREPSLYDPLSDSVSIPGDLPLAGRSFVATLRKVW